MKTKNIRRLGKNAARTAKAAAGSAVLTLIKVSPVFADSKDLFTNLEDLIKDYYDKISGIAIGGGLLCAVVAVLIMVISPSDRGSENGKRWLVRILLGIALLMSIGGIYSLIQNMTAGTTLEIDDVFK